jgi:NAD(P)H-dependent flavin oxidoreductase YrpB (nitropropane dioxygenase family)
MPLSGMTGELADMALYAGQSVELVRDVEPAGELIHRIAAQAAAALHGAA